MSTEEMQPTLADANSTTTLALAPEQEPLVTTVPISTKKAALEFWSARRDLHDPTSKAFKKLHEKVELLRVEYENAYDAWRGRKLQEPANRLDAKKRRAATIAKKKAETIDRVCAAVESIVQVKDTDKLAEVVTAALEPAEEAPTKRAKKTARVEEEGDSE